jgi:hypothetical protein
MDIIELLEKANIPYNPKETDNVYVNCPQCQKENLSINMFTGKWHCWSLQCEGNMFGEFADLNRVLTGINTFGFTPTKAPIKDKQLTPEQIKIIENGVNYKPEIIDWAISRALDPDFVMKCGIGYWPEKKAIIIPFRDKEGELIGARLRSTIYKTQWTMGTEPDLYILDYKDLSCSKLLYVEGEPDTLTMKQLGIPCVGVMGSRKDNWYHLTKKVKWHYIGFDADVSGKYGAMKVISNLGEYKCRLVKWFRKDPNQMLKDGYTYKAFIDCLKAATAVVTEPVAKGAKEAIKQYIDGKAARDKLLQTWGYPSFDRFTKGIQPGWVIFILGEGGAGKSTLLINFVTIWVLNGEKVGVASYEEHPISEFTPKIMATLIGRNPRGADFDPREIEYATQMMDEKVFFNDELVEVDEDQFCKWVRELYYTKGVRFFVADYLQLAMEDESSIKAVKKSCYKVGKNLVKEMPDIVIVWAVQPKQLQKQMDKKTNEKVRAKLDGDDVRGGSPIKQSCDVLLLMRSVDGHSDITEYEFDKVRGQLRVEKKDWKHKIVQLQYDHGSLRMYEIKNLIYTRG